MDSSHVPMLSDPGLVLDVIREAVSAVQESAATATAATYVGAETQGAFCPQRS